MSGRAPVSRRLHRAVVPGVGAVLIAGTVALTSAPDEATSPMAAGASTSSVSVGDSAAGTVDTTGVLTETDAAAAGAGGTVSVVVLDADGDAVLASAADESTYTAPLVKLLVVARPMGLDESGAVTLTAEDAALMEAAVTSSDDDAMAALWVT